MVSKSTLLKILLLAFLVKGIYFFGSYYVFNNVVDDINTNIGFLTLDHDVEDHFIPLENWWNTGEYYRELSNGKVVYASRPPGYAPFYLPLYVLTNPEAARSLFALLNYLLDVISCLYLFLLVFELTKRKKIAWFSVLLYIVLPFISVYTNRGKSEPLSTILIIVSSYYFLKHLNYKKYSNLLISSFFLSLSILTRPSIALFTILPFFVLIYYHRISFSRIIKNLVMFGIPIIILLGGWVLRSSVKEGRFIPILDMAAFATPEIRTLFNFIGSINGDIQGWVPGSEAEWFSPPGSKNYSAEASTQNPFDPSTFSASFSLDSLISLRDAYWNVKIDGEALNKQDSLFVRKADKLLTTYKTERSVWHRIKTEVKMFTRFICIKQAHGTMLQKSTFWFQLGKLYWLILYYIVILGSFFGLILGFWRSENWVVVLGLFIVFYMFIHANLLGLIENRYLAAIFPYLTILAGYFYYHVYEVIKSRSRSSSKLI